MDGGGCLARQEQLDAKRLDWTEMRECAEKKSRDGSEQCGFVFQHAAEVMRPGGRRVAPLPSARATVRAQPRRHPATRAAPF